MTSLTLITSLNDLSPNTVTLGGIVSTCELGVLVVQACPRVPHGPQPTRLLCPWNSPGKKTGVGCHFFLQGIFPTQESNPGLLHCRQEPQGN